MADPTELILGVLFKAREDPNFKRITRRLHTIVTGFQQGMDKVDRASKKLDASMRKLKSTTNAYAKSMKKTGDVVEGTGKQIGKITKGLDRLVAAFKVVAVYTVAGRMFQGFQAAVSSGVREIIEFDQALANLKAITGATDQEIANMRDTLKGTALRTKFSTTEIAEGMVLLGQSGLSAAESMQAIDAVADLAAGTLSDFRNVSDLVTTTLRAFNLEAIETRRIVDVMGSAVNKSKLTIDKLRTAFNYVGASAAQAGLSLEVTASTMMILANSGLRASTIGTGFRQVLARLLSPSAKLREAMSRYGLEVDKASGKSDWFEKQLGKLASVMYNFESNTVDMSKAYTLFGLRGAQAASILINAYMSLDGTWEIMLEKARQIGTANEMMKRQAEGLGFKIKNLADSFGVLAINLGEAGLTGAIRGTIDGLREIVKWMGGGVQLTAGRAITSFMGVAGALYTIQLAVRAIVLGITGRQGKALAAFRAFFFGPWGLVALGVGAAMGGITALVSHVERLREGLQKQGVAALKVAGTLDAYIKQLGKVKHGSVEWEALIGRLKQALPKYAKSIDKVSGSYKALLGYLNDLSKAKKELVLSTAGETFLLDLQRALEYSVGDVGAGTIGDPYSELMLKGLDRKNPKTIRLISEFVQFLYSTFTDEMKLGRTRKGVEKEIDELFMPKGKYSKLKVEFPKVVDDVLKRLDVLFDEYTKRRKKQAEARFLAEKKLIETLPRVYQDFINKLLDAQKYETFLKFMDKVKRSRETLIAREKEMEGALKERYDTEEKREDQLEILRKQHYKSDLQDFIDNENKKDKRSLTGRSSIEKALAKLQGVFSSYYEEQYRKVDAIYTDLERRIEKNYENEKEIKEKLLIVYKSFYSELRRLANELGPIALSPELLKEITDRLAALSKKVGVTPLPIPTERQPGGEPLRGKKLQSFMEGLSEFSKKQREKRETEEAAEIEKLYRRGVIGAEEYFESLETLRRLDAISEREYAERKRREQQGIWENFKEGWKDFFGAAQTFGEFVYEVGSQLADQLSDSFGDAFADFVMGTKSAKDAFKDFARDVLRWIAEIAAKQAALSFLGIFGSFGGGGGGGGGMPGTHVAHKGGMYGEFPKRSMPNLQFAVPLHGGLLPNEFAAILRKDEGVFTKKQMAALGKGSGASSVALNTEINVNVDSTGKDAGEMKEVGNIISQTIKSEFQCFLQDELRPGGILNKGIA